MVTCVCAHTCVFMHAYVCTLCVCVCVIPQVPPTLVLDTASHWGRLNWLVGQEAPGMLLSLSLRSGIISVCRCVRSFSVGFRD